MSDRITQRPTGDDQHKPRPALIPGARALSEIVPDTFFCKGDLDAICKLRNDLIHANEVEPEALDVVRKAKFIEALLVIRLLVELGLPTIDAATIGGRIHQHFLIEKHEPRVRPAI